MIFTVPSRFRYAFCQLEALRHCLAPRVRHMLKELPKTLDETYERILRDINEANWDHAHRLLQCLTVAVRPLRIAELAEVLAVDFGTASRGETSKLNTDWRWEDEQEAVLSTCSSLISVVDEEGIQVVQFSHFSVKEFLMSSRIGGSSADVSAFHILLEPAHTVLAKACLGVLVRLGEVVDEDSVEDSVEDNVENNVEDSTEFSSEYSAEDNVKDKFPLARYAAKHWVDHARFGNVSSHIREGMEDLFDADKPYFPAWLQVHNIDTEPLDSSVLYHFVLYDKPNMATPLYYAALCGFHDLTEQLIIKHPQQVNAAGGYYVSPLAAALSGGHFEIAQLLYERSADVDVQGRSNRTPLFGASSSGQLEIVQWLLSRGANPNVLDGDGWTPLHSAAYFGHIEVSRLLLQYQANINVRKDDGQSPLHPASEWGQVNIARLLLEHGADVNARDNSGNTSLHLAAYGGHLDIARLLVEHGANIDASLLVARLSLV
jgi:ankyrin repeat protein